MNFKLKELTDVILGRKTNGNVKGHLYSVLIEGDEETLLEQFFDKMDESYDEDAKQIVVRLKTMITKTGFADYYFKKNEGNFGDHVVAFKQNDLRIYCIYIDHTAIIVGSGGVKKVRAYQDDPELNSEAEKVKQLAKIINQAMMEHDLTIDDNGVICDNSEEHDYLGN